jgi:hypothetical protein
MLDLKRYTREFQLGGNWKKMIEDIQQTLTAAAATAASTLSQSHP